jgi:hypothetical protein
VSRDKRFKRPLRHQLRGSRVGTLRYEDDTEGGLHYRRGRLYDDLDNDITDGVARNLGNFTRTGKKGRKQ